MNAVEVTAARHSDGPEEHGAWVEYTLSRAHNCSCIALV